ncbi:hypothetical protein FGG08_006601 [Glutinoglossum americanum]|uniref:Kinesin-like protein KIP2 n=1 Tax=Glutinoglossum americanum TaxID=1670608 RepID=A0A9P8I0Y3_9PEZI|nr:hypothetical protein FGG08_006601 [Glutinoglossum americanum]
MAATIPKPSRPSFGPPTAALPPLPTPKPRKTTVLASLPPNTPQVNGTTAPSQIPLKPLGRSASAHQTPNISPMTPHGNSSTSNLPSLSRPAPQVVTTVPKTLRRSVSAAAFPHPPGSVSRIASLPPSPLSAGGISSAGGTSASKRSSKDSNSPLTPGGSKLQKPKPRNSTSNQQYTGSTTPSLLNGSGDSKSISSGPGGRGSDGLLSLPSPPQSRSSSAEGSYSTAATTFDDWGEGSRGREGAHDASRDSKDSSSDKLKEGKGNVIVSVRVRPDAGGGDGNGNVRAEEEWMVDGRRSLIAFRGREGGEYYYDLVRKLANAFDLQRTDNVFTPHDKNAKIYDSSAKRLVRRVMEGYHGTVFAYGMTGTGKTFSMQGTTTSPGVIPLAITDIFSYIRETPHREFLLRVSYLEIYNEKIHDLLTPPSGGTGPNAGQQEEIKLREDSKRGVYATPLKEEIVQSPTQLLRVIARGDHQRRTGSTQYNARSSRSHAVVQIVVESRERIAPGGDLQGVREKHAGIPGGVRVSTLSLIDLAGSERAAESKERRAEGAHINRSLLTLGTVIARLSGDKDKDGNPTDKDGKHLPYRDSKLTRLLQPALSGNSLVSILCTIQIGSAGSAAAASSHTGETLNTLKFAARAKNNIVSHAKKADEALGSGAGDAGSRVLLERYRVEILELRSQLELQAKQKSEEEEREREKEAEQRHGEQMLEMQLARTALKERIEHLNRLILCSKSTGVNASGTFSSLGVHPRMSGMSNGGHMSSLSVRSSGTHSTVGVRPPSNGSVSTIGQLPSTQLQLSPGGNGSEDDDSAGEFGDGTATLAAQVRALQADLADKNRYISTLEKRLLQARRSSQSRMSVGFSPPHRQVAGIFAEDGMSMLLKEKDAEIADLRARLDDKERMVGALRSAARKRDVADVTSDPDHSSQRRKSSSQGANGPVVPVPVPAIKGRKRTESVDEVNRILDEMMQDRVESGELIKGTRGSLRPAAGAKRDTLPVPGSMVEPLRSPIVCATLVS